MKFASMFRLGRLGPLFISMLCLLSCSLQAAQCPVWSSKLEALYNTVLQEGGAESASDRSARISDERSAIKRDGYDAWVQSKGGVEKVLAEYKKVRDGYGVWVDFHGGAATARSTEKDAGVYEWTAALAGAHIELLECRIDLAAGLSGEELQSRFLLRSSGQSVPAAATVQTAAAPLSTQSVPSHYLGTFVFAGTGKSHSVDDRTGMKFDFVNTAEMAVLRLQDLGGGRIAGVYLSRSTRQDDSDGTPAHWTMPGLTSNLFQ